MYKWIAAAALPFLLCCPVAGLSLSDLKRELAAGPLVRVDSGVEITEDLTFPANSELEFTGDGHFAVAAGKTVTIDGKLTAGESHIFRGPGRVAGRVKAAAVLPQWFGAAADGVVDDAPALQRAADLAQHSSYRKLVIPAGRYRIDSQLKFRCNIDCFGVLARVIEIDEKRNAEFSTTHMPMYFPTREAPVIFEPDDNWVNLDPAAFAGIEEGSFKLPVFAGIEVVDGSGRKVDLEPGGTLNLSSSDFFTSRFNGKLDEFYTRNDICSVVSPQGDVFPEFIFEYRSRNTDAKEWNAKTSYKRGDYCVVAERLYKCSFPSGPEAVYEHKFKGAVKLGSHSPADGERKNFTYKDGGKDSIRLWVEVKIKAAYLPPQSPLTVNNLVMEISSIDERKRMKPINTACLFIRRGGMTFNRLNVRCVDRYSLIGTLVSVKDCCNLVFNDCSFSGATFEGLGYNISNGNVAQIVYNNCTSVNARKGMAGRHGKNITVTGGHYNLIDDHYGANYSIRGAVLNAVTTNVPGYPTPKIDLDNWGFAPSYPFVFCGKNFSIEDCQVYNASGLFATRSDVADCYGTISIRNISIFTDRKVLLFRFESLPDFDYAHLIRVPDKVEISNVTIAGPDPGGYLRLKALNNASSFPVVLNEVSPVIGVTAENVDLAIHHSVLKKTQFTVDARSRLRLTGNEVFAPLTGLPLQQLIQNYGNFPEIK